MKGSETCQCKADWLHTPPNYCRVGDVDYANDRWISALRNEQYNEFLQFMCPKARGMGIFPPLGIDPTVCDRPIMGTYDDHDFGWNDGNKRLPDKAAFKEMYLDAIGEAQDSPRRGRDRGAWYKYTLNADLPPSAQIDVFLLDERYERESIPCDTRRSYCEAIIAKYGAGEEDTEAAWCLDFFKGGYNGTGTCCNKDEIIFHGWCKQEDNQHKVLYRE